MSEIKKERKKGGRPKVSREKLEMILPCRMTKKEHKKVLSDAQKVNLKPSELGRQYITKGFVTNLFSEEEQHEKKQLIGIRNNLNQLVKLAHLMGFRSQVMAIDKMLNEIDSILERYKYVSKSKRNR